MGCPGAHVEELLMGFITEFDVVEECFFRLGEPVWSGLYFSLCYIFYHVIHNKVFKFARCFQEGNNAGILLVKSGSR